VTTPTVPTVPTWLQMRDALRLAFGTLTVLPVSPPSRVDKEVAGWAMALGPLVGTVLGLLVALAAWGLSAVWSPLLVAVVVVGLLAVASRLIHWDGLADTADGLGSGREAGVALEIMRRSDVGPFGVFTVVLVFAVQVSAVATLMTPQALFVGYSTQVPTGLLGPVETQGLGRDLAALVVAVVLGRIALALACRSGQPAARSRGLGAAVAGSVGLVQLAVALGLGAVVVVLAVVLGGALTWLAGLLAAVVSAGWALAATEYLRRVVGGVTGDTLGALVETTTAVALVVLAAGS
jgi:adenosylcobinamide-GDP ribazoletransferase